MLSSGQDLLAKSYCIPEQLTYLKSSKDLTNMPQLRLAKCKTGNLAPDLQCMTDEEVEAYFTGSLGPTRIQLIYANTWVDFDKQEEPI